MTATCGEGRERVNDARQVTFWLSAVELRLVVGWETPDVARRLLRDSPPGGETQVRVVAEPQTSFRISAVIRRDGDRHEPLPLSNRSTGRWPRPVVLLRLRALGRRGLPGCGSFVRSRRLCREHSPAVAGRSGPRGRRDYRNRGIGIASPEQPREPKQSWRAQAAHA